MSITRSQIARQLMAGGGMMSETAASYSSPTARAADDRFSPASDRNPWTCRTGPRRR